MAAENMAVRAANALMRVLGKDEVEVYLPLPGATGITTGLGLSPATETMTTLQPVVVRNVANDTKALEIVTSQEALTEAADRSGAADVESLLAAVTKVGVKGKAMRIKSIRRDRFGGTTYLWTLEARE